MQQMSSKTSKKDVSKHHETGRPLLGPKSRKKNIYLSETFFTARNPLTLLFLYIIFFTGLQNRQGQIALSLKILAAF